MRPSMSRAGSCYDNAFLESCFGATETELDMTEYEDSFSNCVRNLVWSNEVAATGGCFNVCKQVISDVASAPRHVARTTPIRRLHRAIPMRELVRS